MMHWGQTFMNNFVLDKPASPPICTPLCSSPVHFHLAVHMIICCLAGCGCVFLPHCQVDIHHNSLCMDLLTRYTLLSSYTGEEVPAELKEGCLGAALAIWTTTPWTMPANAAVAVNEKLQYSLVEAKVHNFKS